jgi:activator of HSP90 ATPase
MIFAVVIGLVILLCFAVVFAIAKDRGPTPDDVAVSYEMAWDRFDFDVLWTLSGSELRDGLDRHEFVDVKRAAYANQRALSELGADVTIEDSAVRGDAALVTTCVALRDGTTVHNNVQLARRTGRWQVVAYQLAADSDPAHRTPE